MIPGGMVGPKQGMNFYIAQIGEEESSDSVDSSLFKSWSLGVGRGNNGGYIFT